MNSATPKAATDERIGATKDEWVEPSVVKIDVGEAEAGDGSGPDAGFIS